MSQGAVEISTRLLCVGRWVKERDEGTSANRHAINHMSQAHDYLAWHASQPLVQRDIMEFIRSEGLQKDQAGIAVFSI
jgi:hypothetical protein